jgi:hypothetical protein
MDFGQLLQMNTMARGKTTIFFTLLCLLSFAQSSFAQSKVSVQVKVFDQDLKPVKDIEIAFNDLNYFRTNSRGTAIVELDSTQIPIRNVRINDEKIEAASWNLTKGIAEVIVRPRSYRLVHFIARFTDGSPLVATRIVFNHAHDHDRQQWPVRAAGWIQRPC